jgi:hypothetical protein
MERFKRYYLFSVALFAFILLLFMIQDYSYSEDIYEQCLREAEYGIAAVSGFSRECSLQLVKYYKVGEINREEFSLMVPFLHPDSLKEFKH